ncbi:MAG: CDP-diacylglycerol--serine O-phosphatidyltransferase [Ignavibacteria bacterium]|nr:CDP-diacylglycerol--serine O-phosphatidyltransferase [Ignavibacteria bacterium]
MRITRSIIPNLFTLANLFSGFSAIVSISEGDMQRAGMFIVFAGLFDVLDGAMARLTHSTSELGVELDSLCDAVSFGVAPSFLLYSSILHVLGQTGVLIASLSALAGVYRLARFNVQLSGFEDKLYFSGMPIPSGALILVSYGMFIAPSGLIPSEYVLLFTTILVIIVALAMISTIKFDNIPKPTISAFRERPVIFILGIIAFAITIYTKGEALFYVMCGYLLLGIARAGFGLIGQKVHPDEERDTLEDPDDNPFDL